MSEKNMWFDRRLFYSKAYRKLKDWSVKVLFHFYCKADNKQIARNGGKIWIIANNGDITFTYKEAEKEFGYSKPKFSRILDDLIEKGFIEMTHLGGGLEGDSNKFAIIEEWKKYGKKDFKVKLRKKSCRKVGFMKDK